MKKLSFVLILLAATFVQVANAAATKEEADAAYQKNNFSEAVGMYEEILNTQGESAAIYYNLGNAYYKSKNIAKAVLNYERALLLNPGDSDIRFNLEMARSKTVDQITPTAEVFIVTWYKSLVNTMSERSWSFIGIFSFILCLITLSFYIFGKQLWLRKTGFVAAIVMLVITIGSNVFAGQQKDELVNRTGAIIMEPSVAVKSTPNESGTDLFVLHEGTKVYIDDNSMKEWKEIRLEDGNVGWVKASSIEVI
ncbi:tetratricopeptide repeat protein [Bacteroides gallinaceum]|uniref:tetratricopeptide repeat protein n=1 Tax=Bacteroides TaxID=816 RepID=UPI0021ACCBD2|nr:MULTISPECIES: tetratricopeptide repeat protein [Bacteroides]MCR8917358.1 tetratricopeptide repeat protein [Bacteroides sp. ET225]MDM8206520.1 tetratricopeptide repeat protein [Bacteroides gallinaceum]